MPRGLKHVAKRALLNRALRLAVHDIAKLPAGEVPSPRLLEALQLGWANEGFAAQTAYLQAVAQMAAITPGPILECGSGLTTILVGLLAGRRGVPTCSLEHVPEWRVRVTKVLERFAIPNVVVCSAPLRSYGDFEWYEAPLASMPLEFQLVICDGPPGTTLGGRYGLLPIMREKLPKGCVILVDDAARPGEVEVLRRWKNETRLSVSSGAQDESFAIVTLE